VGTLVKGTVEKKESFGLFINIGPGVTGLLPKSKWRDSTDFTGIENKKRGDEILVQVDQIQFEERKLSLRLAGEADDQSWREHSGPAQSKGFGAGAFAGLSKLKK
jgi:small subunit ribosomal protein S1